MLRLCKEGHSSPKQKLYSQTLIKLLQGRPTLVLYSELLWDMGKPEDALELRGRGRGEPKAGNSIRAEGALMNIAAIPTLKKLKSLSAPVEKIEIEPVTTQR